MNTFCPQHYRERINRNPFILETLEREKFWIDRYFKKGKERCFNLSDHVMGGNTLKTPEIKLKHHIGLKKSYTPALREKRRIEGLEHSEESI